MNGLCVNTAENMNRKIEGTGQIARFPDSISCF